MLLYFAHARETATLRDRLNEAQQRISGLEGRLAQLMQSQAAAARRVPGRRHWPLLRTPGVAPAPVVRRVPQPRQQPPLARGRTGRRTGRRSFQPQRGIRDLGPGGHRRPALASATKVIPDRAGTGAPDDTIFAAAAATAAATNGQAAAARAQGVAADTQAIPVAAAAAQLLPHCERRVRVVGWQRHRACSSAPTRQTPPRRLAHPAEEIVCGASAEPNSQRRRSFRRSK